ncbi:apoptosis-inducing factor 1, mitochondrial isoform X1 [Diorhabda sublineata]|uniref:apoptosis-inducing factor 1, mitochondrial isoform X1 n=1 Tax=Diorhabda sublineata TaxID=1163346 RepID=UPI0024E11366|nr:apoptosis-inducing factor 1, mitochondrial isoform X1 [Diorhabda sublineata]
MIRIIQISKNLTVNHSRNSILRCSTQSTIKTILNRSNTIRSLSDKCDDDRKKKVGDKPEKGCVQSHPSSIKPAECKTDQPTSGVKLKDCNPIVINPCKTPVIPQIPSLKDCHPTNLMSEIPEPAGNWEEKDSMVRKQNRRWLLLGLLFTAFTVGTIFYINPLKKEEEIKTDDGKKKEKKKYPASSKDIPKDVPYLLIGGGTASFSAFRSIKTRDPTAKVLMISNDLFYPYMRPPLSKEIWYNDEESAKNYFFKQWNGSQRSIFYEPDNFYTECKDLESSENGGLAVARGWTIKKLDVIENIAYLDDGAEIRYRKCLIATGAKPNFSPVFANASTDPKLKDLIRSYRNITDFEELYDMFKKAKTVAIVGGGFLGSELACALGKKAKDEKGEPKKVYQIFRESGNMGKVLPEYLSLWSTDKVQDEGAIVLSKTEVVGVRSDGKEGLTLTLNNGKTMDVDFVIVAMGVTPNTDLAEESDLEVDPELGGFLVNTELQARTDVYIAGDCACFYDTKLGRRRFEHHDHAVVTGKLAGENMTGGRQPYLHQSMFWSDLGPDVGYEAIGIVDSSLPTVAVFAKATDKDNPKAVVTATDEGIRSKTEEIPQECDKNLSEKQKQEMAMVRQPLSIPNVSEGEDFGKGIVFYLRDDVVVGILLWNIYNRMNVARQVLMDHKKYEDLNDVAKLFNIHETTDETTNNETTNDETK